SRGAGPDPRLRPSGTDLLTDESGPNGCDTGHRPDAPGRVSCLTGSGCRPFVEGCSMTFTLYLVGFLILIGGVAWGLTVAHVPSQWVAITCVILLGLGILTGAMRTRSKDPPA